MIDRRRTLVPRIRLAFVGLAILVFGVLGHSSQAEFEFPFVDSTNAPTNAEFHSVWSYHRAFRPSLSSSTVYNGYEAFAVGKDLDPAKNETNNGLFYFYNGSSWSKIPYTAKNASDVIIQPVTLNAVSGQVNVGDGTAYNRDTSSYVTAAGIDGKIFDVTPLTPQLHATSVTLKQTLENGLAANETRDLYALDYAQRYQSTGLAGGQGGLLLVKNGLQGAGWYVWSGASGMPGPTENITDITYANLSVVYVTTSTFTGGAMDRTCAGSQTSRLYKVSVSSGVWTLLPSATRANTCYYGLAAGTIDAAPANHGPQQNILWIASSAGVFKYDEGSGTLSGPLSGTSGKKYYAVSAIPDRAGQNQNLLVNGNFESWSVANPVVTDPGPSPDGWLATDEGYGTSNAANSCGTNTKDQMIASHGSGYAIKLEPAKTYLTFSKVCLSSSECSLCNTFTGNCAVNPSGGCLGGTGCIVAPSGVNNCQFNGPSNFDGKSGADMSVAMAQSIPISVIEGMKFRVTGEYKVEFLTGLTPTPQYPEGGVSVNCTGNWRASSSGLKSTNTIPCSLNNRQEIRTVAKGNSNTDSRADADGYIHFDLTLSRQDLQYADLKSTGGDGLLTPSGMLLEIRCESTYGTRVHCDNLKVEEVNTPPVLARDTYTVIAGGQDYGNNGIAVNVDAYNADTFTNEPLPPLDAADRTNDILSMNAPGLQHVYVAGEGLTLLSRTPSTLTGYIWAGTADVVDTGATAGTGYLSVSCVNNRDPGTSQTLCQRSPQSYGLSLDFSSDTSRTVGSLTGRAWFGKNIGSTSDNEMTNLGSCLRKEILAPLAGNSAYTLRGSNWLSGMCDVGSHRCYNSRAAAKAKNQSELSAYSCWNDFECFGRCEKDQGFICVNDGDCRIGTDTLADSVAGSTNNLSTQPSNRLKCSASSPLACAAGGWLSVNASDFTNPTAPVLGESIGVNYNTLHTTHNNASTFSGFHELSGWGRFMTLANSAEPNYQVGHGWVRFRGDAVAASPKTLAVKDQATSIITSAPYLYGCQDCVGLAKNKLSCAFCQDTLGQSCKPSYDPGPKEGSCTYFCGGDPLKGACFQDSECATGTTCRAIGFCTLDSATQCAKDEDCAGNKGYCNLGAVCQVKAPEQPQPTQCYAYGVNLSVDKGQFGGLAWSQDYGWLDFRNVGQGSARYFQTRLGDIYAGGTIGDPQAPQPPGINNCNSTYLIISSATIANNFCSSLGTTVKPGVNIPSKQGGSASIPVASPNNVYQNILGRFDLVGMEKEVESTGRNKYSSGIVEINHNGGDISAEINAALNAGSLGGRVFNISDDAPSSNAHTRSTVTYTISSPITIRNSTNLATQGSSAGMIVINGDLEIDQNIIYGTTGATAIDDLRKLQNLVIVVKGNLTIKNTVQKLVGAYYVTDDPRTDDGNPATSADVEGAVSTSDSTSGNTYPLEVRGLMIAKSFNFGRKFAGTVENPAPSELIIYDGRLQSNPLPGMTDFAKALPNTSVTP